MSATDESSDKTALSRRNILLASTTLAAASALGSAATQTARAQAPSGRWPNIVVIWGDDIGITDLSAYSFGLMGFRTPNIDRVAREGMIFTDCYGEQSCTAGRSVKTGTPAAFFSDEGGRDIQQDLIEYVAHFTTVAAGQKFNPHVTIGVATEDYLNKMLAEPFPSFTFSAAGASVYQLGSFGTARKELKALTLAP
jgi:Sulfatase